VSQPQEAEGAVVSSSLFSLFVVASCCMYCVYDSRVAKFVTPLKGTVNCNKLGLRIEYSIWPNNSKFMEAQKIRSF